MPGIFDREGAPVLRSTNLRTGATLLALALLAAVVLAGVLLTFQRAQALPEPTPRWTGPDSVWIPQPMTSKDEPGRDNQRTVRRLAHMQFIVGTFRGELAAYLTLAEKRKRPRHLESVAPFVLRNLSETQGMEPYTLEEIAHLEQARRELDGYLTAKTRDAASLGSLYVHVHNAVSSLDRAMASMSRDRKGAPR